MAQNFNYYAIVGSNGYGIVKTWHKCNRCLKYFKRSQQKGFFTVEDAYCWLKDEFSRQYSFAPSSIISMAELEAQELFFIKSH